MAILDGTQKELLRRVDASKRVLILWTSQGGAPLLLPESRVVIIH